VSPTIRTRWIAVVTLASLYVLFDLVELAVGKGGWPQIVGVPVGLAVAAYGVARVLGWEGLQR
jgi:uncharacterized membrane protein (DUF2068 family)